MPVPEEAAFPAAHAETAIQQATSEADRQGIRGKAVTQFLLQRVAGIMMGLAGPPVLVPAQGSPISIRAANNVAVGEVDNDGRPDLIVLSGQSRRVMIFLGLGDGRFAPGSPAAVDVPESPSEVALGDINGDKNLDIALASHDTYR